MGTIGSCGLCYPQVVLHQGIVMNFGFVLHWIPRATTGTKAAPGGSRLRRTPEEDHIKSGLRVGRFA
jgi:hypothetical protein